MQVATEITTFTCICCPLGCRLEVSFGEDGQVEVEGNTCARGAAYAVEEATAPSRMVTGLAQVEGRLEPVSVKTASPVPKERMADVLAALRDLRALPPVGGGRRAAGRRLRHRRGRGGHQERQVGTPGSRARRRVRGFPAVRLPGGRP